MEGKRVQGVNQARGDIDVLVRRDEAVARKKNAKKKEKGSQIKSLV